MAVKWALENFNFADPNRVGFIGWSHGGLVVLADARQHARDRQFVFTGMPVSDPVERMGYPGEDYRAHFSASYHIGKTAEQDLDE